MNGFADRARAWRPCARFVAVSVAALVSLASHGALRGQAAPGPPDYTEIDWHWLLDGNDQGIPNWTCSLGDPAACAITQEHPAALFYIFDGDFPFHIPASRCTGGQDYCGFVYHFAQANNRSRIAGDGPFGHQNRVAGDDYWGYRCPESDPLCATTPPDLFRDRLRPDNPSCDLDADPVGCEQLSWQLKSAFTEAKRGHKFLLFAKLADLGPKLLRPDGKTEVLIKGNRLVMNLDVDPSRFRVEFDNPATPAPIGYETVFTNAQDNRWCDGSLDPTWSSPDCPAIEHPYRLTDLALIPDPLTQRCDLPGMPGCHGTNGWVGYLNWYRDNDPAPGCNCCQSIRTAAGTCARDITRGATFVIVRSRVGTWFVDRAQPKAHWRFVPWGGAITFGLPAEPGISRRTFEVAEVVLPDGSHRYEAWQVKNHSAGSVNPCPGGIATARYNANLAQYNPGGETIEWTTFDPADGAADDAVRRTVAWARPWFPSAYPAGAVDYAIQRFDYLNPATGARERWLLYGSRDNVICDLPNGPDKATGRGVYAIRLRLDGDPPVP